MRSAKRLSPKDATHTRHVDRRDDCVGKAYHNMATVTPNHIHTTATTATTNDDSNGNNDDNNTTKYATRPTTKTTFQAWGS